MKKSDRHDLVTLNFAFFILHFAFINHTFCARIAVFDQPIGSSGGKW